MKYIRYIFAFSVSIILLLCALLAFPSFQDRLLDNMAGRALSVLPPFPEEDALSAVVCGSRSPLPGPAAETCILIRAGSDLYVVDIGDGSASNLRRWAIPFEKIHAVLLTHLHSDHIADLADLHLASWIGQDRGEKLRVYGPEGVTAVTAGFEDAYRRDYQYRYAHHGARVAPIETAGFEPVVVSPSRGVVLEKEGLSITAFEVDHHPASPAFGYRFDYKGRSIVVSGDTTYSESLVAHAQHADVLFHDALSTALVEGMQGAADRVGRHAAVKVLEDIKTYHATTLEAAQAANRARVGHLVLYHLVPSPRNTLLRALFVRGMDEVREEWTLARDGTRVVLPVGSKDILISTID